MNRRCISLIFLIAGMLVACTGSKEAAYRDRADIIKLALERAVVAGEIPDYHLIKDKQNIALSDENISPDLVPQIPGINLELVSEQQIQERADREDIFFFLRFQSLEIELGKATVTLANIQAAGKNTKEMGFGGSFTIEYQKESGKWEGKVISMTVSEFNAEPNSLRIRAGRRPKS